MKKETTMKDALDSFLKNSGLNILLKNENLLKAWRKTVGPEIAGKTRIVGFNRGVLTVEVASGSLYSELKTYYLGELADSIRKEMGNRKVRQVKLRLGEIVGEASNGNEEQRKEKDDPAK